MDKCEINRSQTSKSIVKTWFLAIRPRTLSISFVPLVVGTALAWHKVPHLNWMLLFSIFFSVPWIQIGMNLINDALDFQKGKKIEVKFSQQRSNLLSNQQFLIGGYLSLILALFFGLPLIIAEGWPFAILYLVSVPLGYFYTGGPFPLSYTGTSESFILIFYGWVSTCAAYFIQTGQLDFVCFLAGTQIGLLAIVPHAINNLRDCIADSLVQKRTLAVRLGTYFARWEISLCSFFPFVLGLFWIKEGYLWVTIYPFLSFPIFLNNILLIWKKEPSPQYTQYLAKSALCQLIFASLMVLGM